MKEYKIFNLECTIQKFKICKYEFVRVSDYEAKIGDIHTLACESRTESGQWLDTIEEKSGTHQQTYIACWNDQIETEPESKVHVDGKLILDILLLFSVWGKRHVCTGESVFFKQHHYYNDRYFRSDQSHIEAIEIALESMTTREDAKSKRVFPSLFLLQDSNLTRVWQYKVLYLSPAIDIISKGFTCKMKEMYSKDELKFIEELKHQLKQTISSSEKTMPPKIKDNILQPLISKINNIGSVTAVDQIFRWVQWTLDITDSDEIIALLDHCIAFNQFRNSVVHFAGLPTRDIKIRLSKNKIVKVSKDLDEQACTTIGINYFFVFREILQIWLSKTLGVNGVPNKFDIQEVKTFINSGNWRDSFIFEGYCQVTIDEDNSSEQMLKLDV